MTGSRAEYGLLRWLMQGIKDDPDLTLQLVATGMHLVPEFGLTYEDIESDGFQIDYKVQTLGELDNPEGISNAIAEGIRGCSIAFSKLQPDIIVLLGDRFEIFAAGIAAMTARIPIAHIHGGESTEGLIDEAIRHSLTKMSHLHFVATATYRDRVIQLGENPDLVFQVGALGLDSIKNLKLLGKKDLENSLNLKFAKRSLLVTFHPVTLEKNTAKQQMTELLEALSTLKDVTIIFTFPNADTGGQILIKMINKFVSSNPNSYIFKSLGQLNYLSCMQFVDAVVGNSSSGLIEAPSFKIGTINIGDRQKGRLRAQTIIDCSPLSEDIVKAIKYLYSKQFQQKLSDVINPYGISGASAQVLKALRSIELSNLLKKKFNDLGVL